MSTVETLVLTNVRNHKQIRLNFREGINVIWGENGSGKTSILEAIYVLSLGKSFRTNSHKDLLQTGAESLSINAVFKQKDKRQTIMLNQLLNAKRRFKINETVLAKTRDLVGENPVVLLSPEEQIITKGSNKERRVYFDKVFSIMSNKYLNILVSYKRILKQRNSAIQLVRKQGSPSSSIVAWDEAMVQYGKELWEKRKKLINVFTENLKVMTNQYTGKDANLNFKYFPQKDTETYEKKLKKALNSDIKIGWSTVGPHRDNYLFNFNERPLREFGSQGEHKIALVMIKLSEMKSIQTYTGKKPILLLDDLFAKLDFQRADGILSLLKESNQAIVTTTNIVDFEQHGVDLKSKNNTILYLERECKP